MNIEEDIQNTIKVHDPARKAIHNILKSKGFKVGVEIGVQYGLNVEPILDENLAEKIYGIDPYNTDIYQVCGLKDKSLDDKIYQMTLERLSRFGDRYVHVKKTSNEALIDVPGLVDFVYIDGSKTRQATWDDITYWWPKIRERGVMFIHDYGHISYPHIKLMVDKYFLPLGVVASQAPGGIAWVEKTRKNDYPRVSVITPFYNAGFFARDCFNEVIEDDRISEVIVVDDASILGETEMLQNVIKDNPKIKYFRNDENLGELGTRIRGTKEAENEWVIFLDSDNSLTKDYLDKIYMIPKWREDVIYHPAFGNKRHINYREFEGQYFNKKNIPQYLKTHSYVMPMFLNTGNYFMNRQKYLETANKHKDIPKYQYGDIVINGEWLRNDNYIFVVQGMDYVHRLHKNSVWKAHANEMKIKIDETLDSLR